jgi:hypothetical protein
LNSVTISLHLSFITEGQDVELKPEAFPFTRYGRRQKIRAGRHVSAEIRTGARRVIEYLLSPVMQAVNEAGNER